jgi:UDP-N-acetylmuramate dehydrogenase
MRIEQNFSLLNYNTFGIDARAAWFIEYDSKKELKQALGLELVKSNRWLHIGGGSNLLFLKDFDGVILHSNIQGIARVEEDEQSVTVEVGAGVIWDNFVDVAVQNGWGGVENLSLIPGETGASAVQNIGAYGVEVKDVIVQVKTVETETGIENVFSNEECRYGYRDSIFKSELRNKIIVTSVVFRLDKQPVYKLDYQHLEDEVKRHGAISLNSIRSTIVAVRQSKLPDPKDYGNAGSFFMNPVVPKLHFEQLKATYPEMPHYYISEAEEKIPAAWLIDRCGWKGRQIGNAGVHDKQALVLVNKGGATGEEIVHLAGEIQKSVKEKFGVELKPEVNYIR